VKPREARLKDVVSSVTTGSSLPTLGPAFSLDQVGILATSAVTTGRFKASAAKAVAGHLTPQLGQTVQKNSILLARSSGSLHLVGSCVYIDRDYPTRHLPDLLWQVSLSADSPFSAEWLAAYLASKDGRRRIESAVVGSSTMKKLSVARFLQLRIPIPAEKCHDMALRLLRAADRHIDGLDSALHGKCRLRNGLAESAAGSWAGESGPPLCALATLTREVQELGDEGFPVLSCTKHHGLVPSLEYFGRQVHGDNLSAYKLVRRGQFAYATNHLDEGSIGLLRKQEAGLVSPMYTVFEALSSVDPRYLIAVLRTETTRRKFEKFNSGSVNRRGAIRWRDFARVRVPVPPLAEQRRIADTLDLLDHEIALLTRQLELLRKQKRAVLDRLFSGELEVRP
jgi:hypothetical protein